MLTWPCYALADIILCLAAVFGYLEPWNWVQITTRWVCPRSTCCCDPVVLSSMPSPLAYLQVLFGCSAVALSYGLDHAASASARANAAADSGVRSAAADHAATGHGHGRHPIALCAIPLASWLLSPDLIVGRRELLGCWQPAFFYPGGHHRQRCP